MATQLFPVTTTAGVNRATNTLRERGDLGIGWDPRLLSTSRGAASSGSANSAVDGPTVGLEIKTSTVTTVALEWISLPLAADITISGTVTLRVWGSESAMSANAGPQVIIERLDSVGAIVSTILNSEAGTEFGTTGAAIQWTATPTSTAMNRGDRFRVRLLGNDAGGNMSGGNTFTILYSGPTVNASGDTWVQFNEDLTFEAAPTGSFLYLTADAASIPSPVRGQLAAKLSAGSAAVDASTDTVAGWTAPVRVEDRIEQIVRFTAATSLQGGTGASSETNQALAESFRPPTTQAVDEVVVWINRVGLPLDNIVVEIREGSQTGTLVASSFAIGATLGTTAAAVAFVFGGETLTGGSLYYLVLTRSGARDITNYYEWQRFTSENVFSAGGAFIRDNNAWSESTNTDFRFEINDSTVANLEWFSPQLQAFTLGGRAAFESSCIASDTLARTSLRCEIAVCDSDGSNPVVWAAGNTTVLNISYNGRSAVPAGDDLSVTQGQRLRIRVYIDDDSGVPMGAGHTAKVTFNNSSTYVRIPQTVTEYVPAVPKAALAYNRIARNTLLRR